MQLGAQELLLLINKLQIAKSVPEGIQPSDIPNPVSPSTTVRESGRRQAVDFGVNFRMRRHPGTIHLLIG